MTNEQRDCLGESLQDLAFDLKFSEFSADSKSLTQQAMSIIDQLIDSGIIDAEIRYNEPMEFKSLCGNSLEILVEGQHKKLNCTKFNWHCGQHECWFPSMESGFQVVINW